MSFDVIPSDPLTEIPGLQSYTKLTRTLLWVQFGFTLFYHLGRRYGAAIEYGRWPEDYVCNYLHKYNMSEYNKDTMEDWEMYNCANYDYKLSNMDIDELPSSAGLSYPWVGGIWFVLAVWTSALPQTPSMCMQLTLISLMINIAADFVNFWVDTAPFFFLILFSILVFFCLKYMRASIEKLKSDIEQDKSIDRETIHLNKDVLAKVRIVFLLGLAQVYISFPSYRYHFERHLGINMGQNMLVYDNEEQMIELLRQIMPIAAGGILNVAFVSSILFSEMTKLHFVDFFNGNITNHEKWMGWIQSFSFVLTLVLTRINVPRKEIMMNAGEFDEDYTSDIYPILRILYLCFYLTFVCIITNWVLVLSIAQKFSIHGNHTGNMDPITAHSICQE